MKVFECHKHHNYTDEYVIVPTIPENDLQVTIRMPTKLKQAADSDAQRLQISTMEWIRRAMKEKLAQSTPSDETSVESLRDEIIELRGRISLIEQKYSLLILAVGEKETEYRHKKTESGIPDTDKP